MDLEELKIYEQSIGLGERVWKEMVKWDKFAKFSIGIQLIKSVDSIAANLSEGYGRFHYAEKINFAYYSRGSLFETKTWLTKACKRNLITQVVFDELEKEIKDLGIKLNNYIKSLKNQQNKGNK